MVFKFPKNLTLLSKPSKSPPEWQRVDSKNDQQISSNQTIKQPLKQQNNNRNNPLSSKMNMITKNPNYFSPLDNDFAKQLGSTTTTKTTKEVL